MVQTLFSKFRTNLLAGFFTLAPLAAVIWVLLWFWGLIMGFQTLIPESLTPAHLFEVESPLILKLIDIVTNLVLFAITVVLIALVGHTSRNMLGQKILKSLYKLVERIPVLNTVYTSIEQLLKTFSSSGGKNFRKVVIVEYPRKGISTLAFVTGERSTNPITGASEKCFNIYVPTTPNPTSGFYLTVPASEVKETNISVEEALKQIISMGMIHS